MFLSEVHGWWFWLLWEHIACVVMQVAYVEASKTWHWLVLSFPYLILNLLWDMVSWLFNMYKTSCKMWTTPIPTLMSLTQVMKILKTRYERWRWGTISQLYMMRLKMTIHFMWSYVIGHCINGWKHNKIYIKNSVSNKILGSLNKND
jgi:hypothetical protein